MLKAYVAEFRPRAGKLLMPPDTFYWRTQRPWFEVDAEVSHVVALIGDAHAGRMLAYVEYFNLVCIAVIMPFNGDADIRITHAVDVLEGREVAVKIDEAVLASVPWSATYLHGDAAHVADVTQGIRRLVDIAEKRGRKQFEANGQ